MKVRLNWSATAGTQSGFWVAQEEGIFKKNGLEVELIHIPSSSRAIQTMLAGEIAISYGDARNTVQAVLTGANVTLIAGVSNRLVFPSWRGRSLKSKRSEGQKDRYHPNRLLHPYRGALRSQPRGSQAGRLPDSSFDGGP
jgi:hypothetical protein